MMMADDLCEIELGIEVVGGQVIDLPLGVRMRVRPAPERERVIALPQHFPQLPRMLDGARRADGLVAAEHHKRRKAFLMRALRVRQTVLERMLRCQKRRDPVARHVVAEIRDEVAQVVLFLRADGAVGEEDERALPRQPAHRVVGVDPRVHSLRVRQLRPRRPQFRRKDGGAGAKG